MSGHFLKRIRVLNAAMSHKSRDARSFLPPLVTTKKKEKDSRSETDHPHPHHPPNNDAREKQRDTDIDDDDTIDPAALGSCKSVLRFEKLGRLGEGTYGVVCTCVMTC